MLKNNHIIYLFIVILANRLRIPGLVGFETTVRIPHSA